MLQSLIRSKFYKPEINPALTYTKGMLRFRGVLNPVQSRRLQALILYNSLHLDSSNQSSPSNVGIFWDLDNKPPNSFPPHDAAVRLKAVASSFGVVRYMVAYANRHAFSYVPSAVREQRKERKLLNQLENKGLISPVQHYLCRVCGRNFYNNEKLINHFKQIHEREQAKRLNQIESAKGTRRVKLVGKFAMKMEKYRNAAREILTPKVGYGLGDELKRAGFWVRMVSDKPQAADIALRNHIIDTMDKRNVGCVVLVSDDSDFVDVLREAKLRCLKTVVVGDSHDGVLKRTADAGFSWKEVMLGKAKREGASVVGKWKDRDILKRLEWTYNPEFERKEYSSDDKVDFEINDEEIMEGACVKDDKFMHEKNNCAWWELDCDSAMRSSKAHLNN